MKSRDIKIISLTAEGLRLAERLKTVLPESDVWHKPTPFTDTVQREFQRGTALMFICATGIVVRTLGPVLSDKQSDPPVLALDEQGKFVIALLSGHEGGANEWARQVAEALQAEPVMTTANAYCRPVYAVGLGCERGCTQEALLQLLNASLEQLDVRLDQVESLNSIDIKADEVGMLELSAQLNRPFHTWPVERLREVEAQLSVKSDYVFKTVGVFGVCESAALVGAMQQTGAPAELVLTKQKSKQATCAIARSYRV